MFGWLRNNKLKQISPGQQMSEEMTRMINTYIAFLKTHIHHVLEKSWLPAAKKGTIEIFNRLWLGASVQDLKEMCEVTEDYGAASLSFNSASVACRSALTFPTTIRL